MKRKLNIKPLLKGGIFSLIVGGVFALIALFKSDQKAPDKLTETPRDKEDTA